MLATISDKAAETAMLISSVAVMWAFVLFMIGYFVRDFIRAHRLRREENDSMN